MKTENDPVPRKLKGSKTVKWKNDPVSPNSRGKQHMHAKFKTEI